MHTNTLGQMKQVIDCRRLKPGHSDATCKTTAARKATATATATQQAVVAAPAAGRLPRVARMARTPEARTTVAERANAHCK
jgi:hypothetical protein